jgi:hypothetical protein
MEYGVTMNTGRLKSEQAVTPETLKDVTAEIKEETIKLAAIPVDIVNNKYPDLRLPFAETADFPNLDGRKIQLIYAENRADPNVVLAEVERLIQQEHVVTMLGGW